MSTDPAFAWPCPQDQRVPGFTSNPQPDSEGRISVAGFLRVSQPSNMPALAVSAPHPVFADEKQSADYKQAAQTYVAPFSETKSAAGSHPAEQRADSSPSALPSMPLVGLASSHTLPSISSEQEAARGPQATVGNLPQVVQLQSQTVTLDPARPSNGPLRPVLLEGNRAAYLVHGTNLILLPEDLRRMQLSESQLSNAVLAARSSATPLTAAAATAAALYNRAGLGAGGEPIQVGSTGWVPIEAESSLIAPPEPLEPLSALPDGDETISRMASMSFNDTDECELAAVEEELKAAMAQARPSLRPFPRGPPALSRSQSEDVESSTSSACLLDEDLPAEAEQCDEPVSAVEEEPEDQELAQAPSPDEASAPHSLPLPLPYPPPAQRAQCPIAAAAALILGVPVSDSRISSARSPSSGCHSATSSRRPSNSYSQTDFTPPSPASGGPRHKKPCVRFLDRFKDWLHNTSPSSHQPSAEPSTASTSASAQGPAPPAVFPVPSFPPVPCVNPGSYAASCSGSCPPFSAAPGRKCHDGFMQKLREFKRIHCPSLSPSTTKGASSPSMPSPLSPQCIIRQFATKFTAKKPKPVSPSARPADSAVCFSSPANRPLLCKRSRPSNSSDLSNEVSLSSLAPPPAPTFSWPSRATSATSSSPSTHFLPALSAPLSSPRVSFHVLTPFAPGGAPLAPVAPVAQSSAVPALPLPLPQCSPLANELPTAGPRPCCAICQFEQCRCPPSASTNKSIASRLLACIRPSLSPAEPALPPAEPSAPQLVNSSQAVKPFPAAAPLKCSNSKCPAMDQARSELLQLVHRTVGCSCVAGCRCPALSAASPAPSPPPAPAPREPAPLGATPTPAPAPCSAAVPGPCAAVCPAPVTEVPRPLNLAMQMRQRQLNGVCGGRVSCPVQSQAHCQDNASVRLCKDLVPSALVSQNRFQARAFCGRFSRGGDLLCVATQDRHMQVTNVENPRHWRPDRVFDLSAVGWAVIDCDMSPNDEFVVCSSWSSLLALCPLRTPSAQGTVCPRSIDVRTPANTAVFGVKFSPSGHELLLGCSNGYFVLFDAIRNQPVLRVRGHTKDINSVCFLDENVFATGGDDSLTQVWDRRVVGGWPDDSSSFETPSTYSKYKPVGGFLGHYEGITSVASKGDGRYLLTNSKDQSIKLWDCRKMACPGMLSKFREYRDRHCTFPFDYRWHRFKRTCGRMEADSSLVTFEGHTVQQTLIRCDFSPMATTGQRYVVSGSSDGCGYVFDVLSGQVVQRLEGHRGVVRDIAWNPVRPVIVTTSWDNSCNRYEPRC